MIYLSPFKDNLLSGSQYLLLMIIKSLNLAEYIGCNGPISRTYFKIQKKKKTYINLFKKNRKNYIEINSIE